MEHPKRVFVDVMGAQVIQDQFATCSNILLGGEEAEGAVATGSCDQNDAVPQRSAIDCDVVAAALAASLGVEEEIAEQLSAQMRPWLLRFGRNIK